MGKEKVQVGLLPSHLGEFIRKEVLGLPNLSIIKAAEVLDVR